MIIGYVMGVWRSYQYWLCLNRVIRVREWGNENVKAPVIVSEVIKTSGP